MRTAAGIVIFFFPLAAGFIGLGCAGSPAIDSSEAGKTTSYQAGSPVFDIEAIPAGGDSVSAVDLYMSIPYPSLIFEKCNGGFRARYEITADLIDRTTANSPVEVTWAETTFVEQYEVTQSFEPILIFKRIPAAPGSYRLDVTLEDHIGAKKGRRMQGIGLMDPDDTRPSLGRISLRVRRHDGTVVPQISFFLPERTDSIGCAIEAYGFPRGGDSRIELHALRFPADTSIAVSPAYFSVMPVPIGHSLIDFARPDTVWSSAGTMIVRRRHETFEIRVPPLPQGMYRFDYTVTTRTAAGTDTTLTAGRFYSVTGPGFPRPVTYPELIAAATYLANQREMSVLRHAAGPAEQRKQFEAFWLSLGGDPVRAAALIRKYYGRVEEANRLFSIVKEGWRSDRGLLYCVLGPPASVTNRLDTQTWYYDLSGNANENTYVFTRVIKQGEGLKVEDYILSRFGGYESFWTRILAKWRSGDPM